MTVERAISHALSDPIAALRRLDRLDAEDRLVDFIAMTWPILEPGRDFVRGWAVDAICEHLEAVTAGQIRRLLINVPPGCMKSLTTNVFWPSWEWGPKNLPSMRYVSAAYAESLTTRDNRKARMLVQSELYREHWGDRVELSTEQAAKTRFDTTKTGFKVATSVGGLGTGERGDRFIIDDPHNVREAESDAKRDAALQWFAEVVPTRVNDPDKSAIVVIMQRVHERDVSGLILAEELGYDHLCLPMEYEENHPTPTRTAIHFVDPRREEGELLWPERFSRRHVEEDLKPTLRSWGGTYAEAGQLQQRPAPRGGGMFKKDDFVVVAQGPERARRVRGWDLAATKNGRAAYSAGVRLALAPDGKLYIEDVVRVQGEPGEVEELLKATAKRDGPGVEIDLPQDPGQSGKAQVHYLVRQLQGFVVHFSPETGSKEDRARPLASQCSAGNLHLVQSTWVDAFRNEASMFPAGRFKDQVDALSRAYARMTLQKPRPTPAAPVLIDRGS